MAFVAGAGELGPGRIDRGRVLALEGKGDSASTSRGRGPVRIEGADRVLGVQGQAHAATELDIDMRLIVCLRWDIEPDETVEGEAPRHIGDYQFNEKWAQFHTIDGNGPHKPRLVRFGHIEEPSSVDIPSYCQAR